MTHFSVKWKRAKAEKKLARAETALLAGEDVWFFGYCNNFRPLATEVALTSLRLVALQDHEIKFEARYEDILSFESDPAKGSLRVVCRNGKSIVLKMIPTEDHSTIKNCFDAGQRTPPPGDVRKAADVADPAAVMSKFSRWYANAVQPNSKNRQENKLESLPAFPWEMTPSEFNGAWQEAFESGNARAGHDWGSPYGNLPTTELGMVLELLDLWGQPLASGLLAFPVRRTKARTENQVLSRVIDQVIRDFENRELPDAKILLLDCHVKQVGFNEWSFRPSGSSKHFPGSLLSRSLPDEVSHSPKRLISLVEVEATEGDRGPEIEFVHIKSFDAHVFDELDFPLFSGLNMTESIRLKIALSNLLEHFRFSGAPIDQYMAMRSEYRQIFEDEILDDEPPPRQSDRQKRWSQFVVAHYPAASVPSKLEDAAHNPQGRDIDLPASRLIRTPRDAEEYAAEVMEAMGFTSVVMSPVGPDGGIDVASEEALAQVKLEGRSSTREQLQRLTGVTLTQGTAAIFFSLAGYTKAALDWAEATDMALFEFAYDGSIEAKSSLAVELVDRGSMAIIERRSSI